MPARRTVVALLATAVLVASACSDDRAQDDVGAGPDAGSVDADADADAASGSTATAAPADGDGSSPGQPADTAPGSAGGAPPSTGERFPADPGIVPVGGLATFVLRPDTGTRVVVEVRAQDGAAPRPATIDHVVRALGAASGKEVVVDGPRLVPGDVREWTGPALSAAADAAAVAAQGEGQAVLRLLFVRGSFEGDPGVLGAAVRGDVAAVFPDQVDAAAGALVDPAVIEDAVTMHELGHLLGLVDLVLGTGRADPEHPGHSPNRGSVMYWQVESGLIAQLLGGGIPREFDAEDRAELRAIRAS